MTSFRYNLIQCVEIIKEGGLILYPTDTIWGIGCDATNEAAVSKIYQLKQRPEEKAMIILLDDQKELPHYVKGFDRRVLGYLERVSKPTTVIYSKAKNLAKNLVAKDGSVAIRICKDEFCNQLIKESGKPIVSTSANISGTLPPRNYLQVGETIKNSVDYIVTYRQDEEREASPSAVVKWVNGRIEIVRP